MTQSLLEIRSLSKSFPIREGTVVRRKVGEVVAVDDVSFDVFEGETLGCVGGSGSGKSTLGRLILNLIPADRGSVRLDGVDLVGLSATEMRRYRRGFQIVFQDPLHSLNPRRTVAENIARPLLNFDVPREEAKARVDELLDLVGLNPAHANRYPHEFSGGQCQRIGIARALALKPRFLFLDEPVSALDVSIQAQILNLLKDLQNALNLTYLFVAHDLKVVKHFSDRIIVLYHGRIVEIGGSDEVYHEPKHPYTRSLLDSVSTSMATTPGNGSRNEPACSPMTKIATAPCAPRQMRAPAASMPVPAASGSNHARRSRPACAKRSRGIASRATFTVHPTTSTIYPDNAHER